MALYEFRAEDVGRWAETIPGKKRTRGDQLEFECCPYCKAKDKWTFSISMKTGQFECKRASCRQKGNMLTIARDFEFSLTNDTDRYYGLNEFRDRFRTFKDKHKESTDPAIRYLQSRGISEKVCREYEITTKADNDDILVFPFKDKYNNLRFIKYRNLNYKKGEGSKEFCEKDCMPILFGMNHCSGNERLIITEGQIDSLSVTEAGIPNAVSVPTGCNGFTWIPHCWDWFIGFKEIVIFGDNENGKITLVDELSKRFTGIVRVVQPEDYKGCKDANEILQNFGSEAVQQAVENAKQIPLYYLKPLEEVKRVKIEDLQYIPTGITSLDEALSGGIHEGELVILSGKRGGGKSTFASQILCSVTNSEHKSFVYSGELPDFIFRAWFDKQYFGSDGVAADYDGKIFLFDNNVIQEDDHISIIQAVEEAIKRYDVKFILLDNLMTIIDAESSERLYRAQSRFVGQLSQIAKKYNVCVLLVVHPRKMQGGDLNDDVAGAAEITNKADIVMTYSQNKELMPDERYLTISKNRLTGKLLTDKILYFDEHTKRISDVANDFNWVYGLQKMKEANKEFVPVDEEDVPF